MEMGGVMVVDMMTMGGNGVVVCVENVFVSMFWRVEVYRNLRGSGERIKRYVCVASGYMKGIFGSILVFSSNVLWLQHDEWTQ